MAIRYVGVRHHSPACARLARHVIRELSPAYVLIEGPADMNDRMNELLLEHELPLAIFSYYQNLPVEMGRHEHGHGEVEVDDAEDESGKPHVVHQRFASWSPFCDYSPEWVAIKEGAKVGAEVLFIDLPSWDKAFAGVTNRYSDGDRRMSDAVVALCERFGVDGMDALWDHLFEQEMPLDVLEERLGAYFEGLRGDLDGGDRDGPREDFMAKQVAHYAKKAGKKDVVVLIGGYHKPALEKLVPNQSGDALPELPQPHEEARHGSFLVPYSFRRLDSFTGYQSGMPSPQYYQSLWEEGVEEAPDTLLETAVKRLRDRDQRVSAADLIAVRTMAEGLARMRGHEHLARVDILDGIAAALVKDAQDAPLPWTQRGTIRHGTDPILVEVVAALSGNKRGKLHPDTPRPPLIHDVRSELEQHDLTPTEAKRRVDIDLTDAAALAKSRILHRLNVLGVPGFVRTHGPSWATDPVLEERWEITEVFEQESAIIEASAYGATLMGAAGARLEESAEQAEGNLAKLTEVLGAATFVGMDLLGGRLLSQLHSLAGKENDFERLGQALTRLLALYRHDTLLGSARSEPLGAVVEAAYDRGLWLVEGISGGQSEATKGLLIAVAAIRDALRFAGNARGLNADRARGVMTRRSVDDDAPPDLRGAALGFLWSMGCFDSTEKAEEHAVRALRKSSQPDVLGDWLGGLFYLAREEVLYGEEHEDEYEVDEERKESSLLSVLDATIAEMSHEDYLVALPALRLAFSYFPPREKERLARRVLRFHGKEKVSPLALTRLPVEASTLVSSKALEKRVNDREEKYGLGPWTPEGEAEATR
jgi:hypothetical protein